MSQSTTAIEQAEYLNYVWSYDFVFDQTPDSRTLKHLAVVDVFTKESLMIDVQRPIIALIVVQCLDYLFDLYGTPTCIKSDSGPEFVAKRVQTRPKEKRVNVQYIGPGSPWQNGHVESFNSVLRDACLERWGFYSLAEACRVIEQWRKKYNEIRPHGALT